MSDVSQAEYDRVCRERDRWKTEAQQSQRALEKGEVKWAMLEAARVAGLHPASYEDLVPLALADGWGLDSKGRLRQVTASGPEMEADGSYKPPAKWLAGRRKDRPHWWSAGAAGDTAGTAAPASISSPTVPAGMKNPYAKDSENWTAQGLLERENPSLARRLAEQAGVKIPA